jgi:hypothetical protein
MATYKFYQHKEKWFYLKRPGFDVGKEVDAHVMDTVLGITGNREYIVILPAREPGSTYRVRISNGFIIEAELHDTSEVPSTITEFFARDM